MHDVIAASEYCLSTKGSSQPKRSDPSERHHYYGGVATIKSVPLLQCFKSITGDHHHDLLSYEIHTHTYTVTGGNFHRYSTHTHTHTPVPSKVHVRRQRLPKNWKTRSDACSGGEGRDCGVGGGGSGGDHGGGDDDGGGGGFIGELDLAVGRTVNVWGRKIKLVGCDPFTQAYYRCVLVRRPVSELS